MRFDSAKGKIYLDYGDVQLAANAVAMRMKKHSFKPARILAVARGGLIPAAMLSHLLGVKEVGSIQLESYDGDEQGKIRMYHQAGGNFTAYWDKPDTLIVDDLWDSGQTHEWLHAVFPSAITTTLFYKDKPERSEHAHKIVSFPGSPLGDHWIVFPWELDQ